MSKTAAFDPFAYTQDLIQYNATKYVKKNYLRDNKIRFDILTITEEVNKKFGNREFQFTIRYQAEGETKQGIFSYGVGGKEVGVVTRRDTATRAAIDHLNAEPGRELPGYYLVGSGTAYALSNLKPTE